MIERTRSIPSTSGETCPSSAGLSAEWAEAIPVPIVLMTPDARIRYANTAFVQALGIEKKRYLHKKFPGRWLTHAQEGLVQLRKLLYQAIESEVDPPPIPLSLRSADRSKISTEVHARSLSNPDDGRSDFIVLTFQQIDPQTARLETNPWADRDWRRLENELKHSEERLRILFEYAPDGYYLCDLKGRFVDGNKATERIIGYKREELIGKSFLELNLLSKSQIPKAARALARNAVGKPTGPDEFTLSRKDGSPVTVEISTYPVRIQDQVLVLGIARDVTERRRAEEEQRRSDRRFKAMTDSAQDAIMMMDPRGRIAFYNKASQNVFGWTAAEALGKNLHSLIAPERFHEAYHRGFAHFQQMGEGNAIGKTLELTALRKDGTEFPIEISLAGVELDNEWHAIGIVRDITKRKQAEEAVLREKAFSDSVINTLPGVFYMFDEEGKYVWWNENMEDVIEYSSDEIPHIHPVDLFGNSDKERIKQAIAKAFREGKTAVEADLVSKSGWKTPYYFTGVRVERDGNTYLAGLGIDITTRRKAQAVLEKLNEDLEASVCELERSNRELRDFAHITAHDLKAPLRGIGTLVDWLAQDYGEQIDEEGQGNLQLLKGRVDRMGRLVNGILRYSKIGHGDRCTETLDTDALVGEIIEQIAPPENMEIRIENPLPPVSGERTRLTQVFQNLITNAIKYIDKPQGQIRISARDDGVFWEFRIDDNGPGIEAKHFDRIFQMFQTLSSADHDESTGLGLAVVKKIVDLHGGRVWLESEIGQGSSFFFTLPKSRVNIADGKR